MRARGDMAGSDAGADGVIHWDVRRFDVLDSTNRFLLDEARTGAPEGTVVVADFQDAGRGRLDRRWLAPPGSSLLVSLLLRPALAAEDLHLVVAATALSASDACEVAGGSRPAIKWPNDLVAGDGAGSLAGRKLAGILAEADWSTSPPAVVVGIGINVNWPEDLQPDHALAEATALNRIGGIDRDRDALLEAFLGAMSVRYRDLATDGGRRRQMGEYRQRCNTIGQPVSVATHDETFGGTALDVDDGGRLLVDVGACIRTVAVGDVVHLRPAG